MTVPKANNCSCNRSPPLSEYRRFATIVLKPDSGLPCPPDARKDSSGPDEPPLAPSTPASQDPGLPPTYEMAMIPSAKANETHTLDRYPSSVAAMPLARPLPIAEHLDILDRTPVHVEVNMCASCYGTFPSRPRPLRYLGSRLGNRAARSAPLVIRRIYVYDVDSRTIAFQYIDGLQIGERQRAVRGKDPWTTRYVWGFAARHEDPAGAWMAEARIFFADLPRIMSLSIPWRDETRILEHIPIGGHKVYPAGSKYKTSVWYLDDEESPVWCAEMTLYHESLDSLLSAFDSGPWDYFAPETCLMAGLDQRTWPGRCKKVMWYHRGVGYGNDILGRPPDRWDKTMMEAYAEFVRPFMPAQGEPETQ